MPRWIAVVVGVCIMSTPAAAQVIGPTPFGKTADGQPVETFTLRNKNGVSVKLMTLGAAVTEINVPDKQGKLANVVLGFDDVAGYESKNNQYFGCTVGRVANRIAKGKFTLDGNEYKLAINNDPNHLHGGARKSFDKVVWSGREDKVGNPKVAIAHFHYVSRDGEEGYPGTLSVSVSYRLWDDNRLEIVFYAYVVGKKATPINLTNHSYFNLAGAGAESVLDHELMLNANEYVPVDKTLIPTGKLEPVNGTIFDFTKPTRIGERIAQLYDTGAKGYDHCYVLTKRQDTPTLAARLREPKSGRVLTVSTTQPGVQLYTGNFLFGQKGAAGKEYKQRSALCLETCHFPDAVNQPTFPPIILRPGQTYEHRCIYAFSAE